MVFRGREMVNGRKACYPITYRLAAVRRLPEKCKKELIICPKEAKISESARMEDMRGGMQTDTNRTAQSATALFMAKRTEK